MHVLLFKVHIFDSLFPNYSLVMAMGHEAHYETKERQREEDEEEGEKNPKRRKSRVINYFVLLLLGRQQ